jgi:hypothetical protein
MCVRSSNELEKFINSVNMRGPAPNASNALPIVSQKWLAHHHLSLLDGHPVFSLPSESNEPTTV